MYRDRSRQHSSSHRGLNLGRMSSDVDQASCELHTNPCPELEACELIVGVDFTKSNTWKGKQSFEGKCLHDTTGPTNPYVKVLELAANTLDLLDDDRSIPCFGFGDVKTGRDSVFSFFPNHAPALGLASLVERYKEIVPIVNMSGPTTFAPLIRQALREVYNSGMKFHALLIVADGQVSKECLEDTRRALADASHFPLSVVTIGVGDGPWEEMERFDKDPIEDRAWDNFEFIEFNKIKNVGNGSIAQGRTEPRFESAVIKRIKENISHARELKGNIQDPRVSSIIAGIPNSVLINPPPY